MVDFALALSTLSQALKLANDLRGIEKVYDAAEAKLKIAQLTSNLADLKITLVDAKDELSGKQAEIDRLTALFKRHADLVEANGYKYDNAGDGRPKGHAYCPVCEQLVTTLMAEHQQCPKCKALYTAEVFSTV
jgi:hypothetical protein